MNPGLGQAPRVPEAPPGDLARHHEQAPPGPHQTRLHAVGEPNPLDELRRDEDCAGHPIPVDKNLLRRCLYGDTPVCVAFCAR